MLQGGPFVYLEITFVVIFDGNLVLFKVCLKYLIASIEGFD